MAASAESQCVLAHLRVFNPPPSKMAVVEKIVERKIDIPPTLRDCRDEKAVLSGLAVRRDPDARKIMNRFPEVVLKCEGKLKRVIEIYEGGERKSTISSPRF